MKPIFTGFAAIILIGLGSALILPELGWSSAEQQSSENVRLD